MYITVMQSIFLYRKIYNFRDINQRGMIHHISRSPSQPYTDLMKPS